MNIASKTKISRCLSSLFLAPFLLFAAPANAADPNLIKRAGEIAEICAEYMPDARRAKEVFKEAGFRFEGIFGDYYFYTLNGRRIIAGTSLSKAKQPSCLVAVSKLTTAEAVQMAQFWVKKTNAKQSKNVEKGVGASWDGTLKGRKVGIAAMHKSDFGFMRGAGIIMIAQ